MISEEKLLQFIKKIIFIISQVFYKLVLEMTSAVASSWIILLMQVWTCSTKSILWILGETNQ